MRVVGVLLGSLISGAALLAYGFKAHDFKTCSQSGFCRRGRALAKRATEASGSWSSPYSLDPETISFSSSKSSLTARVRSSLYSDIHFELQVHILENGVVRVRMDEIDGLRKRYDEAASWALISEPVLKESGLKWADLGRKASGIKAIYDDVELQISYTPLKITLLRGGRQEIVLNNRGLLHMEHFRAKIEPNPVNVTENISTEGDGQTVLQETAKPSAWFEGEEEDEYWEETFSSWTDSKPKGSEPHFTVQYAVIYRTLYRTGVTVP